MPSGMAVQKSSLLGARLREIDQQPPRDSGTPELGVSQGVAEQIWPTYDGLAAACDLRRIASNCP